MNEFGVNTMPRQTAATHWNDEFLVNELGADANAKYK